MGGDRRRILVGLAVAMLLGFVVYMKLWTIDYSMSSDEAELLRRQFDLANREAMDESAEWRRLYDHEVDRVKRCNNELNKPAKKWVICTDDQLSRVLMKIGSLENQLKKSFENVGGAARTNQKLTKMQEENFALRKQVDALQQTLEAEKSRCGPQ